MSNSNFKQSHPDPKTITESQISHSDITDLISKYKTLQEDYLKVYAKPVLIFVGDSGVGKTSCICSILNLNEENNPEIFNKLNISHHGNQGTTEFCKVEGNYLCCIDIRGKERNEKDAEYTDYIKAIIGNMEKDIHLIVGVVKAQNERDDDIKQLLISLQSICLFYEKPFIILMNHCDSIRSFERYREREAKLIEFSDNICAKHSWYGIRGHSFNKGVFTVAARTATQLALHCPRASPSEDPLEAIHACNIVCLGIRYCRECNQADVAKELMDPRDADKFHNILRRLKEEKNATINNIKAGDPIGLTINDKAIKTIIGLVDDLAGAAVIKSVLGKLGERIKGAAIIIEETISWGVYLKRTAKELDEKMCARLANLFELPTTSVTQARYEQSRWIKVELEWTATGVWRYFTKDETLSYYLASWGIYYALKFRDIAVTISHGFAKGTPLEELIKQCQKILEKHTEERQKIYLEYITEYESRERAYKKYLIPLVGENSL